MEKKVVQTAKGAIEYTWRGNGPVVLMLHGGHSNCEEEFGCEEWIRRQYSVLIPSRPGYGKTDAAVGTTAEEAADGMIDLLDRLEADKVIVVGISAGGPTALHFCAKYPERVDKLLLESAVTKPWLQPSDKTYKAAQIIFRPGMEKFTWGMIRTMTNLAPAFMFKQMMSEFSTMDKREIMNNIHKDDIEQFRRMNARQASGQGFMFDLHHRVGKEVLAQITAPTLILHSKYDQSVPVEHAYHAHAHIQGSELFVSDIWGHLIWLGKGKDEIYEKKFEFVST